MLKSMRKANFRTPTLRNPRANCYVVLMVNIQTTFLPCGRFTVTMATRTCPCSVISSLTASKTLFRMLFQRRLSFVELLSCSTVLSLVAGEAEMLRAAPRCDDWDRIRITYSRHSAAAAAAAAAAASSALFPRDSATAAHQYRQQHHRHGTTMQYGRCGSRAASVPCASATGACVPATCCRSGASPGQNMWGGQTWRARSASL